MLRWRITAGHDDKLLETGFSEREAEQDMLLHGIKILWLCRGQLQHHVNGFYLLCGRALSDWCNDSVNDL